MKFFIFFPIVKRVKIGRKKTCTWKILAMKYWWNELPDGSSSNPRPIQCIEWMKNLLRCRSVIGYSWENQSNLLCELWGKFVNWLTIILMAVQQHFLVFSSSGTTHKLPQLVYAHQQFSCERKNVDRKQTAEQKIVAPLGIATQINWAYSIPIQNRLNIWRRNNENLI